MKVVLLTLVVSLTVAGATFQLTFDQAEGDVWYVPNNTSFGWVEKSVVEAEMLILSNTSNLVQYYLWTKDNPSEPQLLVLGDISSLKNSSFNSANPTRIMAHGFQANHESEVCTLIKDAYLQVGPHNVICIDFDKIAHASYPTARLSARSVGNNLGAFIEFLISAGEVSMNDLIVAGHSLGAHIVGYAAKSLQKTGATLPIIVGCDPAAPMFLYEDCSNRLCNTDADFVESIQTGAGGYGFYRPVGDGTYYPNGGRNQPGCSPESKGGKIECDHLRSYQYWAEAIVHNDFPSAKCSSFLKALFNECGEVDDSLKMGSMESNGRNGTFYVPTNSKSPYGNSKES